MNSALKLKGYTFILLASFFWGTSGTVQTFAPSGAAPATVGAIRVGLGGAALFVSAIIRGKLPPGKDWPYGKTLAAAAAMAAYQIFFFSAVAETGVAVATVVTMGSSPVMAGIFSWIIYKEKPGIYWYLATVAAITGCGFLLLPDAETIVEPLGILLSLGGGLVYALYAVVSKDVLADKSAETLLGIAGLISGLILFPVLVWSNTEWLFESAGFKIGLYLGFISMAVPYLLFNLGLRLVPVASAMTLTLAEPLTAALLGIFLVGERLALLNYFGLFLILLGISLLTIKN
ncbi:DMT family transporter [Halarsenatibacter silvermanii]|uniref:Drug/metabolite transporter, DME family n=1 Tax=Halarsenatibacter silvermanii TaxID=321763 RepID=A0A1G9S765_9FIRM|nr:EamA family transporter [Halarsenatibacter silvermanii]SDM31363.1 drug/metabolite transporter, DME family [Halarsenatibacter silvermanii]